jgi:hypothetical protein
MPHYRYFDRVVDSDLALPDLSLADLSEPAVISGLAKEMLTVRATGALPAAADVTWYDNPSEPIDTAGIAYGRLGQHYFMRFSDIADFTIDGQGQTIVCHPGSNCPPPTLHHLLLDQVLPRLLGQQGHVVLHASMVEPVSGALGFIGPSGWGKSTLAASFASENQGVSGDDALLLGLDKGGRPWCAPAYCGARLWADSIDALFEKAPGSQPVCHYSSKRRVEVSAGRSSFSPQLALRALFLLNDPKESSPDIQLTRLVGSAPLMALLQRCFLLDPHNMSLARQLWIEIGNIVRSDLPIYQLSYPRNLDALPVLRAFILNHLAEAEVPQAQSSATQ